MTECERQNALRRLFELCLWPIEYGAEYNADELTRILTPLEVEAFAEELEDHTAYLSWPTELDV